jgi:hypothetical protein
MVEEGLRLFVTYGSSGEAKRAAYAFVRIDRTTGRADLVDAGLLPDPQAVAGERPVSFSYSEGGTAVVRRDRPRRRFAVRVESTICFSTTAGRGQVLEAFASGDVHVP